MDLLAFLRPKVQPKPLLTEVTRSKSADFFSSLVKELPNPDEVLKYESNGRGYGHYLRMLEKDPELRAVIERRQSVVAGKTWDVMPFDESPAAGEQAEFIANALAMLPNFSEARRQILSAPYLGFSVHEPMWIIGDDNRVLLADLRQRSNDLFSFSADTGVLMHRKNQYDLNMVDVPFYKSVLCQYQATDDNPYGNAIAKSLYFYYWFKLNAMRFWAVATEKYGMPTVIGKLPSNVEESARADFVDALETLTASTSMAVSTDVGDIKLLEALRSVSDPYLSFVRYIDDRYSMLLLGGTFTAGQSKAQGSRAAEQVHADATDDIIQSDAELLMMTIQRDIVKPLIDFNYPPQSVPGYPVFNIKYEPEKDRKAILEVLTGAVNLGLEVGESHAREQLNIPAPLEGEKLLTPSTPAPFGGEPIGDESDDQLSLKIGTKSAMALLTNFRDNNMASLIQKLSIGDTDQPAADDNAASLLISSRFVHLASEDPERFLPGLPPLPEPVEGQPMPVQPDAKLDRYQIGALAERQVSVRRQLRRVYNGFVNAIISEFGQAPDEILALLDDMIESKFKRELRAPLTSANRESIRQSARQMAQQLGSRFNAGVFEELTREYLRRHAYESGVIDGIGETVRQTLSQELSGALASGDDLNEMVTALKNRLPGIADWQAERVAVTETRSAANWTVLEMGNRSGLDLEAWFIVDPESCIVCQTLAAGNPYPLRVAQSNLLPHPNCNDYYALTKRGAA